MNKIGEINNCPVYYDRYMKKDEILRGRNNDGIEYYIVGDMMKDIMKDIMTKQERQKKLKEILAV